MRGRAVVAGEGAVELDNVGIAVAARGCEEGNGGPGGSRLAEDVVLQGGIVRRHQESAAADRDDLPLVLWHVQVRSRKSEVGSQKSEVRSRKSEVGRQKSDVRSRTSEVGSQKSEVRSRKSEVG